MLNSLKNVQGLPVLKKYSGHPTLNLRPSKMSSQCKTLIDAFFEFLISFSCSIVNGNARPRDSQFSLPPFKCRKASVKVLHWYAECDLLIVKTEANVVTDELVETLISDRHDSAAIFARIFSWRVEIELITKITVSSDSKASNQRLSSPISRVWKQNNEATNPINWRSMTSSSLHNNFSPCRTKRNYPSRGIFIACHPFTKLSRLACSSPLPINILWEWLKSGDGLITDWFFYTRIQ